MEPERQSSSVIALVVRISWFVFLPALVFIIACLIAFRGNPGFWVTNAAYVLCAALVPITRFIDIKQFNGETAEGTPATMGHWTKHALLSGVLYLLIWVAAQAIARFM